MKLLGTTTFGTLGSNSIYLGVQPTYIRATVAGPVTSQTSTVQKSEGMTDGNYEIVTSIFNDGTLERTKNTVNKIVSLYGNVGGSVTEILGAEFTAFTPTGVEFNVTKANTQYQVILEIDY